MLSKEFIFGCQKWTHNAPTIILYTMSDFVLDKMVSSVVVSCQNPFEFGRFRKGLVTRPYNALSQSLKVYTVSWLVCSSNINYVSSS